MITTLDTRRRARSQPSDATARPRLASVLAGIAVLALGMVAGSAQSATLTVTSSADTDGSTCGASCTLRQAINAANIDVLSDTINFNVPGGIAVIRPQTDLPAIRNALFINGYSQSGSVQNTSATGFNGVIRIEINGDDIPLSRGLLIQSPLAVTISGIAISGFDGSFMSTLGRGIELAGTGSVNIRGCFIGLTRTGSTAPNQNGIRVLATQTGAVNIGSNVANTASNLANRNVISTNLNIGVVALAGAGTLGVLNNLIGTDLSGTVGNGNAVAGISTAASGSVIHGNIVKASAAGLILSGAGFVVTGNVIGRVPGESAGAANDFGIRILGAATGTGRIGGEGPLANQILSNTNDGIEHTAANLDVDFALNRIIFGGSAPGEIPVDLVGANGFDSNDAGDPDVGPNGLQNRPSISSATRPNSDINTPITVSGTLNSLPNTSFRIEFFGNRGRTGDVTTSATTDANGNASFGPLSVVIPDEIAEGIGATATRVDATSGLPVASSERGIPTSVQLPVLPVTFTVNSTTDPGDGSCDGTECSLREAMLAADSNGNGQVTDLIQFAIPGAGPHMIALTSPLPALQQSVEIDGYTQSGASANTDASGVGSNAVLKIEIRGGNFHFSDFSNSANGMVVRGLSITGFNSPFTPGGLGFNGANSRFEGNWIGVRPDGSEVAGRLVMSMQSLGGVFGGDNPAQRNVFVNPQQLVATRGRVVNNLFGVLPDGRTPATVNALQNITGNESALAIFTPAGEPATRAERNVFSTPAGFPAVEINNAELIDNSFGESWDRQSALPLGSAAVASINSVIRSSEQRIRGALDAAAIEINSSNLTGNIVINQPIVGGAGVGIRHFFASSVSIRGPIHGMANIAIDLVDGDDCSPSCVTPNDPGDGDTGSNGQQNFPELVSAFQTGSSISVTGLLDSLPNNQYRIVICGLATANADNHGNCDEVLEEELIVTTDGNGLATIVATVPHNPAHQFLTATASLIVTPDVSELTSEFSLNLPITVESALFASGFE